MSEYSFNRESDSVTVGASPSYSWPSPFTTVSIAKAIPSLLELLFSDIFFVSSVVSIAKAIPSLLERTRQKIKLIRNGVSIAKAIPSLLER